ncbi:MAG: hypothetical protein H5U32_02740 [Pseudomonas balearica]|uniref:hypothetical protein n=1 Tax=Stutzerimonas balearica TaxID=74829 RepID=UPI00199D22D6|nr:hypothetical protein [Stutzerimonas balearica]MBC7198145.1 hypothetical protein [Stutzerimonas balearica]
MSFDWKPYALAAICALLCWNFWMQKGAAERERDQALAANTKLVTANSNLRNSISRQNEAVSLLRISAEASATAAVARAATVQQAIPRKIQQDRAAGTAPEEMNKWLESLFSSH